MIALKRLSAYFQRFGAIATGWRLLIALYRGCYLGWMHLYSCPLPVMNVKPHMLDGVSYLRVTSEEVSKEDYLRVLNLGDPVERSIDIAKRFEEGATLWLAKADGVVAGFGWTIIGKTVSAHFFSLKRDEIHLFDFHVFPEFRGRRINVGLVNHILAEVSMEPLSQAHIECAAWNYSQIRSLRRTPFHFIGNATKLKLPKRRI